MKGDVRIVEMLSEVPGAVFTLELDPGAEVEIAGPAVVSSPQNDEVLVRELDEFDIALNSFFQPMWVCAPRRIGVKNVGKRTGTVIVFSVGASSK